MNLGSFLAFVVLLQFGYPVTFHGAGWTALYLFAYVGVVLFGVLLVRGEDDRAAPAVVAGAALLLCAGWAGASRGDGTAMVCVFVSAGAFQVVIVSSLLRFVYRRSRTHELELILAAVCVYLLLGGFFAVVFGALESVSPGSFTARDGGIAWQQLTYFSYVTLATLGYGDVVPVSPWARTAATAEAVTGTLFLITIVGRLVGAYIGVHAGRDRGESGSWAAPPGGPAGRGRSSAGGRAALGPVSPHGCRRRRGQADASPGRGTGPAPVGGQAVGAVEPEVQGLGASGVARASSLAVTAVRAIA